MATELGKISADVPLWLGPTAQKVIWAYINENFGERALEIAVGIYHAGLFRKDDLDFFVPQASAIGPAGMGRYQAGGANR
ncbi:hypothetical protein [Labrys miyagiensis]